MRETELEDLQSSLGGQVSELQVPRDDDIHWPLAFIYVHVHIPKQTTPHTQKEDACIYRKKRITLEKE